MEGLYVEGVATHGGPESCAVVCEGGGEALTGARAGRAIEPRNVQFGVPTHHRSLAVVLDSPRRYAGSEGLGDEPGPQRTPTELCRLCRSEPGVRIAEFSGSGTVPTAVSGSPNGVFGGKSRSGGQARSE